MTKSLFTIDSVYLRICKVVLYYQSNIFQFSQLFKIIIILVVKK